VGPGAEPGEKGGKRTMASEKLKTLIEALIAAGFELMLIRPGDISPEFFALEIRVISK
jgi:hypothetical protein